MATEWVLWLYIAATIKKIMQGSAIFYLNKYVNNINITIGNFICVEYTITNIEFINLKYFYG